MQVTDLTLFFNILYNSSSFQTGYQFSFVLVFYVWLYQVITFNRLCITFLHNTYVFFTWLFLRICISLPHMIFYSSLRFILQFFFQFGFYCDSTIDFILYITTPKTRDVFFFFKVVFIRFALVSRVLPFLFYFSRGHWTHYYSSPHCIHIDLKVSFSCPFYPSQISLTPVLKEFDLNFFSEYLGVSSYLGFVLFMSLLCGSVFNNFCF